MCDLRREDEDNMPHALCMPCPSQGHINSMLQLAKLLHHSYGFHVTFVHTDFDYARILASSGPASLAGSDHFRFESIPDCLDTHSKNSGNLHDAVSPLSGDNVEDLSIAMRFKMGAPFRQLLNRLNDDSSGVPKVTCIVSDTYASFTLDVAAEFGIPDASFCSTSACGFLGCFSYKQLIDSGIVPIKSEEDLSNGYLDTPINSIPGLKNMRLKDLPSFIRTTNPHDILLNFSKDEAQDALKATAFIINTFDELEGPVLDALASLLPPVYAVGPLNLLCRQILDDPHTTHGSSMWKEDTSCLQWLDGRAPGSVIFVNFGSLAVMSDQHLIEFGWGIANSGYDFLWVIRPEMVKGESTVLPQEFLLETSTRGLLASWCPQKEVLRHASIGGFMTHCGWNSTMESMSEGVPMICWPYFADQQPNCRYLCNEWGVGIEIDGNVKREQVEEVIREVMEGEKGKEMRRMAMKWKERAVKATEPNGTSFLSLERVVNEVLLQRK